MWSRNSAGVRVRALGGILTELFSRRPYNASQRSGQNENDHANELDCSLHDTFPGEFAPSEFRLIELCSQGVEGTLVFGKFGLSRIALLRKVRHRGVFKVGWVF